MRLLIVKHGGAAAAVMPREGSVIVMAYSGAVYADNGYLLTQGRLKDFCRSLGATDFVLATPTHTQRRLLADFVKQHTKKEGKGRARTRDKDASKRNSKHFNFTSERERGVIGTLRDLYDTRLGIGTIYFDVKDSKGKSCFICYVGQGQFIPAGSKDSAAQAGRARWAAKKLEREFEELDIAMFAMPAEEETP